MYQQAVRLAKPFKASLTRVTRCLTTTSIQRSIINDNFYNAEQLRIQETVKKIVDNSINPYIDQWEADGIFPAHKIFKEFGDAGLLGICKPTEYGGLDLSYKYNLAFLEALGHCNCGSLPMAIAVQTDAATPALTRFGSDELKKQYLAPSIAGDMVSCIGVSEAVAGSDVAGIKTFARRDGDDLIINGSKLWITNGAQADWMCCLANTAQIDAGGDPRANYSNKSLICVPMKSPGVKVARTLDKLGMRCSDTAEIFFEDVRVPASNIIGEPGMGFMYQMVQFQEERLACAIALVAYDKAIESTSEYAHQRMLYGKPLICQQSVHFRLAELLTEVEALRSMLYRAADLLEAGENVTTLVSMVKLKAGRVGREVADACLQYWGGMGYTNEVLISRRFRDFRLCSIGGGADEVMLSIIAKAMGNIPSKV